MSDDYDDEDEGFGVSGGLWNFMLVGFALVFVGIIIIVLASLFFGGGSVGGVIFICPIPIVFGSGPDVTWLIALSVAISAVSIIAFLVLNRRSKREEN